MDLIDEIVLVNEFGHIDRPTADKMRQWVVLVSKHKFITPAVLTPPFNCFRGETALRPRCVRQRSHQTPLTRACLS